jgi:SpoVK/Ycf46/Vps4 family AAA+-type ATPase
MTQDPQRPSISAFQSQAEMELLRQILQEKESYLWNPASLNAASYFADLEQEVLNAGWTNEELTEQGQIFASHLEQVWATVPATSSLAADLFQRLSAQVPQGLLDNIVQKAQQVISANLTLADQLVQCVQDSLPSWDSDDLQVLARPFAYAMRGAESESLESVLKSVRNAEWDDLSSIEQARLSLAVARYAIAQQSSSTLEE